MRRLGGGYELMVLPKLPWWIPKSRQRLALNTVFLAEFYFRMYLLLESAPQLLLLTVDERNYQWSFLYSRLPGRHSLQRVKTGSTRRESAPIAWKDPWQRPAMSVEKCTLAQSKWLIWDTYYPEMCFPSRDPKVNAIKDTPAPHDVSTLR